LWVSKQIIEKYGGFVRLRSSVDGARRGTTFSVILPAAESAERKAQAGGEAA
jgi:signal transduction histidine kinase